VAYNPRLVTRKPCRGKGTSGLLTMRSAKARKVISNGGEYDDDGDLGVVQAGPQWHDDSDPKDGSIPACVMEG
jgi:hypothetical protein